MRHGLLTLCVAVAPALAAGRAVPKSAPLTTPFRPPRETVLAAGGEARATVLVPEAAAYAAVARDVVARLETRCGVRLPMRTEAGAAKVKTPTWIVLGNAGTGPLPLAASGGRFARGGQTATGRCGPLALRLYANKLIGSDAVYPGKGGHELRTIPLALDTGAHILFLGGSSPEGVRAAADAFFARLKPGRRIAVPYIIDWACPGMSRPKPLMDAEIARQVARTRERLGAFYRQRYRSACGSFVRAAHSFYLSGDDSYGRLAAQLVAVLATHYCEHKEQPPTFVLHEIVMALDQVDDSAGMTDAARLQAAEWLRQMVEDTLAFWEMRYPVRWYQRGEQHLVWNHQTYPARSIAHAATYLRTRYALGAADTWHAVVENMFAGQIACDQPLEDSANYQWSVPCHTFDYVLATGRLGGYFTTGALKACLEYAIASHDSAGDEATHGDAWSVFRSSAGRLFTRAATLYNDPRYQWMLDRIGQRVPAMWSYPARLEAKEPADHVGLRVFAVHPARVAAYGIEGIAPDRVLDKAVLRSGWQPEADYLMLDGLNVGNHKHLDANAIIRFSTQRRYWLVDMDYIRAAPKHHNSIVVVRDGQAPDQSPTGKGGAQVIAQPPFAAELLCSAASRDAAVLQSRLPDYNGLDWTRSLAWRARDCFVVVDTLRARRAGRYIARCVWRTLGEATLDGNTLRVRQRGDHRTGSDDLQVTDDGDRRVVEFLTRQAEIRFERPLEPGSYAVTLAAKGVSAGADSFWLQLDDGPRLAYHIPIGRYGGSAGTHEKTTPGPTIRIDRPGPHRFVLSLRESRGPRLDKMVLAPAKGQPLVVEAEDMVKGQVRVIDEPEQHFFIAHAGGAHLKLRESFDYGQGGRDGYYAGYPYAEKMTKILTQTKVATLKKGDTLTFANLFYARGGKSFARRELRQVRPNAWVVTGDPPALVGLGPLKLDGLEVDAGMALLTPTRLLAAGATRVVPEPSTLKPEAAAALLAKLLAQAKPAPQPAALPAPKAPDVPTLWRRALPSPVTALAAGPQGILCGTRGGKLMLLDRGGKTAWEHDAGSRVRSVAFATFAGGRRACLVGTHDGRARALDAATGQELWSYTCKPFSGRTGSVATIFAADLDGDGAHEAVAGSDNWHYHGLSARGKLLWRTETVHASTVGCAGDCTGDGRDDVVAGTEYYWPRVLDSSGKQIGRSSGGPVTSAVAIIDLDGDGNGEPLFGMEDCFVRCLDGRRVAWKTNVGGAPTAIEPLEAGQQRGQSPSGRGTVPLIICGSESFSVYALRADGAVAWRTQLSESVNDLAVVGSRIVAGCDDGRAYVLDQAGKIRGAARLPAPATSVEQLDSAMAVISAGRHVVALLVNP